MCKQKIAIVGATGLVGQTFLHLLEEKDILDNYSLKLLASKNSKGQKIKIKNEEYVVELLNENSFDDIDFALFFSTNEISKNYVPIALNKNVKVIDNSSYFRMNENVKLIAFGANESLINVNDCLIANPNCCIIQCIILLNMLKKYHIQKIIYNTYQSVSGSGKQGIDDLLRCRKGLMPLFYETDISFTCIPKIGEYLENGYTEEEIKLANESKKILQNNNIDVVATCVRVPVMFSHGVTVEVTLQDNFDIDEIIDIFKNNPNVVICDKIVPSSILSCKNDKIYVGRIRKHNNDLLFYCVADNVRVGAATNALNILEYIQKLG